MGTFRGKIQDELGNLNRKFTHFVIQPDEKVCTGIDRLNGLIQKLIQRGNPPTDEAKLAKLKEALEIPSLNQLWLTISLRTNPTYAEIVATCKRYDNAIEQQRINSVIGKAHTVSEKVVVCSYPKCGKKGHTAAQCWMRKKEREKAKLKRAGRSRDFKRCPRESPRKAPSSAPTRGRGPSSREHRAFECPDRADSHDRKKRKSRTKRITFETGKSTKQQKSNVDWNRFTRREERDTEDEDSDEAYILLSNSCNNDDEVNMAEDDEYVYLDSCATKRLFILRDQSCLESFVYSGGSIQTTRAGVQLNCLGTGKFKDWLYIRVCNDAVKNICSAGLLRDTEYGLQLLHVPRVIRLCDHEEVITATYSDSGGLVGDISLAEY